MSRCPSEAALELHLLAPERSSIRDHVAACPECRAQLAQMEAEGERFRQHVFPRTLEPILAARRRRRVAWLAASAATPILAAAAIAVLVVWPSRPAPSSDYLGVKGAGLGFTVFASDHEGVRVIDDGSAVDASASLRFQIRPERACRLWILSVDSRGTVSRLYPSDGDGGAPVSAAGALPGGALLDGSPGWERLYAICTADALAFGDLERAARAAAPRARTESRLAELPAGALQASILVDKRP